MTYDRLTATSEDAALLIETVLRQPGPVGGQDIGHAIDILLSDPNINDVDDEILVEKVGFVPEGCSLLRLASSRVGGYLMNVEGAKILVQCLLDRGASVMVSERAPISPLGMMLDAAMNARYPQDDLFDVACILIDKGDLGEGVIDVFIKEMEEIKGRQAAVDLLERSLSVSGQKQIGAYLKCRISSEIDASDIAQNTPLVQHTPGIRRF